jgi:hypothetical protein
VVVAANPAECLAGGEAVKDSQGRQGSSSPADAALAGDLDTLTSMCTAVSLTKRRQSLAVISGDPEIRPADL